MLQPFGVQLGISNNEALSGRYCRYTLAGVFSFVLYFTVIDAERKHERKA